MEFDRRGSEKLRVWGCDPVGSPDFFGARLVEDQGSRKRPWSRMRDAQDLGEHGELGFAVGATADTLGEVKDQINFACEFLEISIDIGMNFEIGEGVTMTFDGFSNCLDGFPFIAFDVLFEGWIQSV